MICRPKEDCSLKSFEIVNFYDYKYNGNPEVKADIRDIYKIVYKATKEIGGRNQTF